MSARVARSSLQLLGMALPLFVAGALGSSVWLQRAAPPTDFWAPQTMVDYLDERVGPSDVVVFSSPEQAGYYTALSRRPVHWSLVTTSPDYLAGDVFGQAEVTLRPLLAEQRTIWTVLSHQTMGAPGTVKLIDWLSAFGYGLPQVKLTDSDIVQHVAYPAGEAPRSVSAEFEGNVILSGARYAAVIPPGAILPVELDWLTSQSQARGRTVFVHFVDDSGRKWSQHDSIPVNGRAPLTAWEPGRVVVDRRGLALPSDLPPGRYWLAVGLYDDSGRLPLVGGGDAVRLGPVVVAP